MEKIESDGFKWMKNRNDKSKAMIENREKNRNAVYGCFVWLIPIISKLVTRIGHKLSTGNNSQLQNHTHIR